MLFITNNSIKQPFVYTQLNDQTVLFQTIQSSISHMFALSLNVKKFYLTNRLDPFRCYHYGQEWTWEQWQGMGTLPSPKFCLVGWGCRIYWLLLCGVVGPLNKYTGYDTKQSDGEVPVMLELWWMRSTPSLPSLPGPLWPGVVAPDRVLSMGQIELKCVLILNWIVRNRIFGI